MRRNLLFCKKVVSSHQSHSERPLLQVFLPNQNAPAVVSKGALTRERQAARMKRVKQEWSCKHQVVELLIAKGILNRVYYKTFWKDEKQRKEEAQKTALEGAASDAEDAEPPNEGRNLANIGEEGRRGGKMREPEFDNILRGGATVVVGAPKKKLASMSDDDPHWTPVPPLALPDGGMPSTDVTEPERVRAQTGDVFQFEQAVVAGLMAEGKTEEQAKAIASRERARVERDGKGAEGAWLAGTAGGPTDVGSRPLPRVSEQRSKESESSWGSSDGGVESRRPHEHVRSGAARPPAGMQGDVFVDRLERGGHEADLLSAYLGTGLDASPIDDERGPPAAGASSLYVDTGKFGGSSAEQSSWTKQGIMPGQVAPAEKTRKDPYAALWPSVVEEQEEDHDSLPAAGGGVPKHPLSSPSAGKSLLGVDEIALGFLPPEEVERRRKLGEQQGRAGASPTMNEENTKLWLPPPASGRDIDADSWASEESVQDPGV